MLAAFSLNQKIEIQAGDCKQRPLIVTGLDDKGDNDQPTMKLYRSTHQDFHYYDIFTSPFENVFNPHHLVLGY